MISLDTLRADTPGTQHVVHLNNAGASLMPTTVVETTVEVMTEAESLNAHKRAVSIRLASLAEIVAG